MGQITRNLIAGFYSREKQRTLSGSLRLLKDCKTRPIIRQKPRRKTSASSDRLASGVGRLREQSSPGRTRTCDRVVNSHLLYQLSYRGSLKLGITHPREGCLRFNSRSENVLNAPMIRKSRFSGPPNRFRAPDGSNGYTNPWFGFTANIPQVSSAIFSSFSGNAVQFIDAAGLLCNASDLAGADGVS